MKYIITESRLENLILDYFDEIFPFDEINWHHPYEYDDETGEEGDDENRIEFYRGDINDEDIVFRWYGCEYFREDTPARDICPEVSIENSYERTLNSYFGNSWEEPFRKWFIEKFDLPVKTVAWM